jgi:hypothetical protein
MIWDDPRFKETYRAKLKRAHTDSEAEVRAQAHAFRAEAAHAGGSSPDLFIQRAGNAAAATLSGYVKSALDAFDDAIASLEAELEESDLNGLRESLEQEIARRAKALPASLLEFTRPTAHPAVLRTILQQAPVKARQLLAERVTSARDRVRTKVRAQELLDRAIVISHDAGDSDVADALKLAIMEAVGSDAPVYTSSELEGIRTGRDGYERVLGLLKKSRMTLAIVTPRSSDNPWPWWAAGVAAGLGKPVFVLRASGVSADTGLPVPPAHAIDLAQHDDLVRLLHAIQGEMRRRPKDPAEIDLEDVLRSCAMQHSR